MQGLARPTHKRTGKYHEMNGKYHEMNGQISQWDLHSIIRHKICTNRTAYLLVLYASCAMLICTFSNQIGILSAPFSSLLENPPRRSFQTFQPGVKPYFRPPFFIFVTFLY